MSIEAGSYLGVKYAVIIGGFSGAVLSLRFIKELTPIAGAGAVFGGTAVAHFFTHPASTYVAKLTGMAHNDIEGAVAFLLGLCALNLIAGVVTLSERIKDDPMGFWKRKE
jgi:hypothetical protein